MADMVPMTYIGRKGLLLTSPTSRIAYHFGYLPVVARRARVIPQDVAFLLDASKGQVLLETIDDARDLLERHVLKLPDGMENATYLSSVTLGKAQSETITPITANPVAETAAKL